MRKEIIIYCDRHKQGSSFLPFLVLLLSSCWSQDQQGRKGRHAEVLEECALGIVNNALAIMLSVKAFEYLSMTAYTIFVRGNKSVGGLRIHLQHKHQHYQNNQAYNISYNGHFIILLVIFADGKKIVDSQQPYNYPKKPVDMMVAHA